MKNSQNTFARRLASMFFSLVFLIGLSPIAVLSADNTEEVAQEEIVSVEAENEQGEAGVDTEESVDEDSQEDFSEEDDESNEEEVQSNIEESVNIENEEASEDNNEEENENDSDESAESSEKTSDEDTQEEIEEEAQNTNITPESSFNEDDSEENDQQNNESEITEEDEEIENLDDHLEEINTKLNNPNIDQKKQKEILRKLQKIEARAEKEEIKQLKKSHKEKKEKLKKEFEDFDNLIEEKEDIAEDDSLSKEEKEAIKAEVKALKEKRKSLKDNSYQKESLHDINVSLKEDLDIALEQELTPEEISLLEYIEPNYLFELQIETAYVPDDTEYPNQWGLKWIGTSATPSDTKAIVAIIDTGVDYNHPDLSGNIWSRAECFDENNNPIEGGCTKGGYDFVDNDADPFPTDNYSHGTQVAGIIGATTNNSQGIASISNNNVEIMILRSCCTTNGFFETDSIARAIYFAVNNGAEVINMSFGGPTYSQKLKEALIYANDNNVIVVAASGNYSSNNDILPIYPANFELDNIISVAALDQDSNLAYFSNYGANTVDIAAPGTNILSTGLNNSYVSASGTSFSAPFVAGAIVKVLSEKAEVVSGGLIPTANANNLLAYEETKNAFFDSTGSSESLNNEVNAGKVLKFGEESVKVIIEPAEDPPPDVGIEPMTEEEKAAYEAKNRELRYAPGKVVIKFKSGVFWNQIPGETTQERMEYINEHEGIMQEKVNSWVHQKSLELEPILREKMLAKGLSLQEIEGDIITLENDGQYDVITLKTNNRVEDLIHELQKDPEIHNIRHINIYYPTKNSPNKLYALSSIKTSELQDGDLYPGRISLKFNFEYTPFRTNNTEEEKAKSLEEWDRDINYIYQKAKELKPILIEKEEAQGNILPESLKNADPFEIIEGRNKYYLIYLYNDDVSLPTEELRKDPNVEWAHKVAMKYIYLEKTIPNSSLQVLNEPLVNEAEDLPLQLASGVGLLDYFSPLSLFSSEAEDEIIIAVIDSGIDYNHTDLAPYMWDGSSRAGGCVNEKNEIMDLNGDKIPDDCPYYGWDYYKLAIDAENVIERPDNDPMDEYGHGTNVAGVIKNIIKQNPNLNIKIMALKNGNGSSNEYITEKAINFARYNNAKIINFSSGRYEPYTEDFQATLTGFTDNGIFVTIAQNHAKDIDNDELTYPCGYTNSNIICVAAMNEDDNALAYFSNYGATSVDIAAPGENIRTTTLTSEDNQRPYETASGTSMSAPYIAGLVAVIGYYRPDLSNDELKDLIVNNSGETVASLQANGATPIASGMKISLERFFEQIFQYRKENLSFPDVSSSSWSEIFIRYGIVYKIINGNGDGTFKPDGNINRVEALKMAYKTKGEIIIYSVDNPQFIDVSPDDWFYDYVADAIAKEYISKAGDNFNPDEQISRGEVAEIVSMLFGIEHVGGNNFAVGGLELALVDSCDIFDDVLPDNKYYGDICWMAKLEIISEIFGEDLKGSTLVGGYKDADGNPTGSFGPSDLITREQVAKIMANTREFFKNGNTSAQSLQGIGNMQIMAVSDDGWTHIGHLWDQITDFTNQNPPAPLRLTPENTSVRDGEKPVPQNDHITILDSQPLAITGETHDADGDEMFYFWNASGGEFSTTDNNNFHEITWIPPEVLEDTEFVINTTMGDNRGYIGKGRFTVLVQHDAGVVNSGGFGGINIQPDFHSVSGSFNWNDYRAWKENVGKACDLLDPCSLPGENDAVEINGITNFNGIKTFSGVIINSGAKLNIYSPSNLTISGDLDIKSGGSIGYASTYRMSELVIKGNVRNNGTIQSVYINIEVGGDILNNGIWDIDHRITSLSGNNKYIENNGTFDSSFKLMNDMEITGNVDLSSVGLNRYFHLDTHALTINAPSEITINNLNANGSINGTGRINISGGVNGFSANIKELHIIGHSHLYSKNTNLDNKIYIDGNISVSSTAEITGDIEITETGSIKPSRYGATYLHLHGNIVNNGAIDKGNYTLFLYAYGDIENNGTWNPSKTYLKSEGVKNITNIKPMTSMMYLQDNMEIISNDALKLDARDYTLIVNSPNILNINQGYLGNTVINGTGRLNFTGYVYGDISGDIEDFHFVSHAIIYGKNINLENKIYIDGTAYVYGTIEITGDMEIAETGSVKPYSSSTKYLHIHGNIVNNGTIDKGNRYLNLYAYGDIENNGTWNTSKTYLKGNNTKNITNIKPMASMMYLQDNMEIISNDELKLDARNYTLTVNSPNILTIKQGYLGNGAINGTGRVNFSGEIYAGVSGNIEELHIISYAIIHGQTLDLDNKLYIDGTAYARNTVGIIGDIEITETGLIRPYGSGHLSVYGNIVNNGKIDKGSQYLYLYLYGDIENNGTWNPYVTYSAWNPVLDALSYQFSITEENGNWQEPISTSNTKYSIKSYIKTPHLWRVRPVFADSSVGDWSEIKTINDNYIPKPDIYISANGSHILQNGTYNLGNQNLGTEKEITFIIKNMGNGDLELANPINLTGDAVFTLINQPSKEILAPEESTTFVVKFTPNNLSTKTATLSIENNDSTENPYIINLTGTGEYDGVARSTEIGGNWSDSTTWLFGIIPSPETDVIISSAVILDANTSVKNLYITPEGSLEDGFGGPFKLTILGDAVNEGVLSNEQNVISGSVENNGDWTGGISYGSWPTEESVVGNEPFAGTVSIENDVQITENVTTEGSVNLNGNTLTVENNATVTVEGIEGGGTISGADEVIINGDIEMPTGSSTAVNIINFVNTREIIITGNINVAELNAPNSIVRFNGADQIIGGNITAKEIIFDGSGTKFIDNLNLIGDVIIENYITLKNGISSALLSIIGNLTNYGIVEGGEVITASLFTSFDFNSGKHLKITVNGNITNTGIFRNIATLTSGKFTNTGTIEANEKVITWEDNAEEYELYLTDKQNFWNEAIILTDNFYVLNDESLTGLYWRVKRKGQSNYSPIQTINAEITPIPEIWIKADETEIQSGESADLGEVLPTENSEKTLSIENSGVVNLEINSMNISGANADEFTIISQSNSSIAPDQKSQFTISFSPKAGGERSVILAIQNSDSDENPYIINLTGIGLNTTPEANAGEDKTTLEGNEIIFQGSFIDPDPEDYHTIHWDFGDGNTTDDNLNPSHIYAEDGAYAASLTITDRFEASDTDTIAINVANSAPEIITIENLNISEGETAKIGAIISDKGIEDVLNLNVNWGDNSATESLNPVEQGEISLNHTFVDNGEYSAEICVSDDDGAETCTIVAVSVANLAPEITTGEAQNIPEGEEATISFSFADRGIQDTFTANINWGDGTETQNLGAVNQVQEINLNNIFGDNGEYSAEICVMDNNQAETCGNILISVENLAPEFTINQNTIKEFIRINEVQSYSAVATDQGSDDLAFTWSFGGNAIYYNNGISPDSQLSSKGIFPFTAKNSQNISLAPAGVHIINLEVKDDDNGSLLKEFTQIVLNNKTNVEEDGFWKKQFKNKSEKEDKDDDEKGDKENKKQIETETLKQYLAIINLKSSVFNDMNMQSTYELLDMDSSNKRIKAKAHLMVNWLNIVNGSVHLDELLVYKKEEMLIKDAINKIETIINNPNATKKELKYAKDLSEKIDSSQKKKRKNEEKEDRDEDKEEHKESEKYENKDKDRKENDDSKKKKK